MEGVYTGEAFSPEDIRKFLERTGDFVDEQVKAWIEYIIVLPGIYWGGSIAKYVARAGLTLLARYNGFGRFSSPDESLLAEEVLDMNWNNRLPTQKMFL